MADKVTSEALANGVGKDDHSSKSKATDGKTKEQERQRVLKVDRIWDKKARKMRYVKTAKIKENTKFARYVVTVARVITLKGAFSGLYVIELRGRFVSDILSEIYKDADDISFGTVVSLEKQEVDLLYHAYPHLKRRLEAARTAASPEKDLIFELESLIGFIEEHYSRTMRDLKDLPPSSITFDYLWTLFPPNVLCITRDALGQNIVHRVTRSEYIERPDRTRFFTLKIDHIDCNGEHTGRVKSSKKTIEDFNGAISFDALPMFPFDLHPEYSTLRESLKARGERVLELRGRRLQEYKGHALGLPIQPPKNPEKERRRDIYDESAKQAKPEEENRKFNKIMINPLLYGFSLGDKLWGAFAVSKISDVVWNDTIIESLVLPKDRKDFIQALVRNHGLKDKEATFDDFVQDKGKGLIGILSGPPGVGKTLTAEAVAEIARRPLYTVTSGELGNDSVSVQHKLARLFELTEIWNAVVLLDEADVFLTKRTDHDLARNAITSVFLRHLEYYQGIMLLTTNRIETMDDAFQSRIHFCFEYSELDTDTRREIWQKFVELAKANRHLDIQLSVDDLDELANLNINGRQIKNCMSISQAVCRERKTALDKACIDMAVGFCRMKT